MPHKRGPLFYWAVAVSWAHLTTVGIWSRIWRAGTPAAYYFDVTRNSVWAALILVWGLGTLLGLAAWRLRSRAISRPRLLLALRLLFMASLIAGANQLRRDILDVPTSELPLSPRTLTVVAVVAAAVVVAIWRAHTVERASRLLQYAVLLLFPGALLDLYPAARALGQPAPVGAGTTLARPAGAPAPQRVVFVVFDELDYRLAFTTDLEPDLPTFDRFRAQAFWATDARQAQSNTDLSIPGLLLGSRVDSAHPTSPASYEVFTPEGAARLEDAPTFLRDAKARGWKVGVVGWHHAYCRLFSFADSCYAEDSDTVVTGGSRSVLGALLAQLTHLDPWGSHRHHFERDARLMRHALQLVGDPTYDLVYLHLPMPHAPWRSRDPVVGYGENLQVADRDLARIDSVFEVARRARPSVLIVTSDHAWRQVQEAGLPQDSLVPLIVWGDSIQAGCEHSALRGAQLKGMLERFMDGSHEVCPAGASDAP